MNALRMLALSIGNWDNLHLNRRQPQGKSAGVMLNEHAEKTFERPKQCAMYHDRPMFLAILADVGDVKPLRLVKIDLYRRTLPRATYGVPNFNVNLWAIKHTLAGINFKSHMRFFETLLQRLSGGIPVFQRADIFFRPRRKIDINIVKSKCAEHRGGKFDQLDNFFIKLFGPAEKMGIILGKAAHPHETVQHAGSFIA